MKTVKFNIKPNTHTRWNTIKPKVISNLERQIAEKKLKPMSYSWNTQAHTTKLYTVKRQLSESKPYQGNQCPLCKHQSLIPENTSQFHSVDKGNNDVLNTYWTGVRCQLCNYHHGRGEVR